MSACPALLRALADRLRRFGVAREAAAAVEFALILPAMLTMYFGSIELSQAFSMDQRVITIAGTTGDLVARANGTIDMATLTNYFEAAQAIMGPYSTTELEQVVTVCSVNSAGTVATVEWSEGYNGGTAEIAGNACGDTHPIPSAMLTISGNNYIIVSEASYTYPPLLGIIFKNDFHFYHQNFYLPRYDKNITCTDCT